MKATDLRIGNLFYPAVLNHGLRLPNKDNIQKVLTIEFDFVRSVGMNDVPAMVETWAVYGYSELEPIPITEEWLRKLGFEQNLGVASREFILDKAILINHYENGFLFSMNYWQGGRRIKYVHQLQNLYFALTGHELTVKEATLPQ